MPGDPLAVLEELRELRDAMRVLGGRLGVTPGEDETAVRFTGRCIEAARKLRLAAGITWADYELVSAAQGKAVFMLKKPPESSPLGGPRWVLRENEGLEELAGKLGMYEDSQ